MSEQTNGEGIENTEEADDGDGDDTYGSVIPLLEAEPPGEYEVEELPAKDSYAVPRPIVGSTHVASMIVTLKDGRIVRFTDPDGALDESRIFPDVIEFQNREIYEPRDDDE